MISFRRPWSRSLFFLLLFGCMSGGGTSTTCGGRLACSSKDATGSANRVPSDWQDPVNVEWHLPEGTMYEATKALEAWNAASWWTDAHLSMFSNEIFRESDESFAALDALKRRHVPALVHLLRTSENPSLDSVLGKLTKVDIRKTAPSYDPAKGGGQVVDLWVNWWRQHKDDPEWRDLR